MKKLAAITTLVLLIVVGGLNAQACTYSSTSLQHRIVHDFNATARIHSTTVIHRDNGSLSRTENATNISQQRTGRGVRASSAVAGNRGIWHIHVSRPTR